MPAVYSQQIVGTGPNDFIPAQVDPTHQALRVSVRPTDHAGQGLVGGHYYMGFNYSNTAAKPAGGSDIVSMRWTDSRMYFVLKRLRMFVGTTTTYTASLIQDASLTIARSFTVSPSAGTQIIPTAGGQRARSLGMKNSGLDGSSGVLWASSGDLLTTGTRTLDTQFIGYLNWLNPITTVNAPTFLDLYAPTDMTEHPIVLGANEGFVIQTPIGNGQAAGVSKFAFVMEWAEVPQF